MEDEFAFISRITPKQTYQPSLVKGIGDDAAVYRGSDQLDEVVCVDTMVEDVHFRRDTLTPFQVGKKALAVNVSDLAAMGAIPAYYLVSIAIPHAWTEEEVAAIYTGMSELATLHRMDLIGGDTVSTNGPLVITVTVIGRVERGKARFRDQAKPGDVLFVTGNIGTSAAGLHLLFEKGLEGPFSSDEQILVSAHQEPTPHVKEGHLLATHSDLVSLNDVSDGVASEANELAEASGVKIIINEEWLPVHSSMNGYPREKQLEWMLFGGEDFVLIGSTSKESVSKLASCFKREGLMFHIIGYVEKGEGVFLHDRNNQMLELRKQGYNHFRKT